MSAAAEAILLLTKANSMERDFRDQHGKPITIGNLVQYAHDRRDEDEFSAWHPGRWGIVTGLHRTEKWDYDKGALSETEIDLNVQVTSISVIGSRTDADYGQRDQWYADPKSLRVIK